MNPNLAAYLAMVEERMKRITEESKTDPELAEDLEASIEEAIDRTIEELPLNMDADEFARDARKALAGLVARMRREP